MAETALYLEKNLTAPKIVVLTGAMIPNAFGTSSDGFFNMGSALAFVQVLEPGVYIAMNGRYFRAGEVKKIQLRVISEHDSPIYTGFP